ncbi:unnamed protein product [Eretmochelys imbricata]
MESWAHNGTEAQPVGSPFTEIDSEGARAPWATGWPGAGSRGQEAGGRKPGAQWTVPEAWAWLSSGARGAQGPLVQAARSHAIAGRVLLRRRRGRCPGWELLRRQLLQEALQLRIQQEVQGLLDIAGE